MKTVILAAGAGIRMRESTGTDIPKQLTKVYEDECLIDYVISVVRLGGAHDVLVILGYEAERIIKESHIQDRLDSNMIQVVINKNWADTTTDDSLTLAKDFVGDNPFMVIMGDTLTRAALISKFIHAHKVMCSGISLVGVEHIMREINIKRLQETQIIAVGAIEPYAAYRVARGNLPGANVVESGIFIFDHFTNASTDAKKLNELANRGKLYLLDTYPWYTFNINTKEDLEFAAKYLGE